MCNEKAIQELRRLARMTQFERNLIAALRQGVSFRNSSLNRGCRYHAKRMQKECN